MGFFAGGRLAAAVSQAGGLGLIGGGYGDGAWLDTAFTEAGNQRVGCGFITWSLAAKPELLDQVLAHAPAALMLSFGSPPRSRRGSGTPEFPSSARCSRWRWPVKRSTPAPT